MFLQKNNKKIVTLIVALVLTLLVVKPLLGQGNISVHDDTHAARLMLFKQSLSNGQFPLVWADSANYTYGYPLFHFYAPAFYYLALVFNFVGASYIYSINLAIITTIFIAAVGMMKFMARRGYLESILATTSFILLPYLAVNIYVRGSYAELFAIALLPWLFSAWRDLGQDSRNIVSTALTTAIFALSHNLIPFLTAPFLLVWIIIHNKKNLRSVAISSSFAVLLSAFFYLPLILERSFVQAEAIAITTNYSLHFLEPWQLWDSTWGYGGSSPGVIDGMSFKIGKPQLILAILGLYFFLRKRDKNDIFLATSAAIGIFFTTQYSAVVWESAPLMPIIQFPWRFLGLIGFLISALSANFLKITKSKILKLALLIPLVLVISKSHLKYFQPENDFRITDDMIFGTEYIQESLAKKIPEYLPTWMSEQLSAYPNEFVSGDNILDYNYSEGGGEINLTVNLALAEDVIIAKTYYPTWSINNNMGENLPFSPSEDGLIKVHLDQGENQLVLIQTNTKIEKISGIISASTLIAIAVILLSSAYKGIGERS